MYVEPTNLISNFKESIKTMAGIETNNQIVMYKNVELKNKISFEELGITTQNSNNHDIRILVKN